MEGFGVNTFRFINDQGKTHFVRFHWKPVLGTHSLAFDEAEILGGKDPDFNRRDLWESIEMGNYPDYELGMVNSSDNNQLEVQHTFTTDASVVFDAVYVDGGKNATPQFEREATHFIKEAFKHYKPIAGTNEGQLWLEIENIANSLGVFVDNGNPDWVNQFVQGVASHRFWKRVLV